MDHKSQNAFHGFWMRRMEARGFEPPTSCLQTRRSGLEASISLPEAVKPTFPVSSYLLHRCRMVIRQPAVWHMGRSSATKVHLVRVLG